jgi:ADP-ribose pyrophosphatase YjhB (NUDIX family)
MQSPAKIKDSFCSFCGTAFTPPLHYPRRCPNTTCGMEIWANPIPVAVVLVPVRTQQDGSERTGLLVVRRNIEPRRGLLVLVGGFVEEQETWQAAGAREVKEEAGVVIDPASVTPFWYTSTEPRPNRVLLFSVAAPLDAATLPAFPENAEASERGLVFGPEGLADVFAFPLHVRAAERYFAAHGTSGPHGFQAV